MDHQELARAVQMQRLSVVLHTAVAWQTVIELACGESTWSTWSAVINLTSRAGELRSAPSGPDDRCRVTGKRALAPGVRVRRAITRVSEGWFCALGFP